MDSQALKSFISIAECGSFTVAAERLHVTQPAISKRIATLEIELGAKLFDRIGRRVSVTESGAKLLPRAQGIIREMEDSKREIRDLSGEVSGQLSIAISHHIGLHRLPPVLQAFSQQYPQVALDISFQDSEVAHDDVLHGRTELAVVTLAPQMSAKVKAQEIWPDPLAFVVSPAHKLSHCQQVTLTLLCQEAAILPNQGTFTGQLVQALFAAQGRQLDILMATNYLETIKMMVSIGLGWSVLPRTMLDAQLMELTVDQVTLSRRLGYIRHQERSLSNAATAFIALLNYYADNPND